MTKGRLCRTSRVRPGAEWGEPDEAPAGGQRQLCGDLVDNRKRLVPGNQGDFSGVRHEDGYFGIELVDIDAHVLELGEARDERRRAFAANVCVPVNTPTSVLV